MTVIQKCVFTPKCPDYLLYFGSLTLKLDAMNLLVCIFQSTSPTPTYMQQRFTQKHSLLPHHRNVNAVRRSHSNKWNPTSHQRRSFLQKMARTTIQTPFHSTGVTKATSVQSRVKVVWKKQSDGLNVSVLHHRGLLSFFDLQFCTFV